MQKTIKSYKELKFLNEKNVYLHRLVKANPNTFKEVIDMFHDEGVRAIFLEGAEEYGWLNEYKEKLEESMKTENAKNIARKMLMDAVSPDDVVKYTELSFDTVSSIANQMEKILVAH